MNCQDFRQKFQQYRPGVQGVSNRYAVLIPLVEREDGLHLLFQVRAATLRRQPGEVCFPGGKIDGDETPTQCALRETWEELGIPPEAVEILGYPDLVHHQSGYFMYPVLGRVDTSAVDNMTLSIAEVGSVFEVPFSFFLEHEPDTYIYDLKADIGSEFPYDVLGLGDSYPWRFGKLDVPIYVWDGHPIWGITGRLTRWLANFMGAPQP